MNGAARPEAGAPVTHAERVRIERPGGAVWDWFLAMRPERVLRGGGGVPGVTGTKALPGPEWGRKGARRRILQRGGGVREEILEAEPPRLFRYRVDGFSGLARLLVREAEGRFDFEPGSAGTGLVWTYAFIPAHPMIRPLTERFARSAFSVFMARGLAAMKQAAEEDIPS
jgi:hypothetical protein